jgi:hypothetical protein
LTDAALGASSSTSPSTSSCWVNEVIGAPRHYLPLVRLLQFERGS